MIKYTICQPGSTETEGPYSADELKVLLAEDKINGLTLYYDAVKEAWLRIQDNEYLAALLFTDEKILELREKTGKTMLPFSLNKPGGAEITVNAMLATAEGKSEDTEHLIKEKKLKDLAASICLPSLTIMVFFSALTFLLPHLPQLREIVEQRMFGNFLDSPLMLLGLMDLILAVMLALAFTEIYPFVRFRASVGFGFCLYFFWVTGDLTYFFAGTLGNLALFLGTISLNIFLVLPAAIIGVLSFGGLVVKEILAFF